MFAMVRPFLGVLGGVALFGMTVACASQAEDGKQGKGRMPEKAIEEVLKQHTDSLMSLPGVVGTAIGKCEGKPCIKVLVVKKTPELSEKIPLELEGFPVVVEETGMIRRLDPR
jgi:hypothetical protein